jgi:uncharacterized membrane protein
MATSDPLPRLADALSDVGHRLREISDELRGLQLGTTVITPNPAAQQPPPLHQTPMPAPPGYQMPMAPPVQPAPIPVPMPAHPAPPPPAYPAPFPSPLPDPRFETARPTLWERLSRDGAGSRILAWAGGVVTLAGVVLLLVLAIQRGYLGPLPRVLLGAGLGLALAGIGMRLHPNQNARTGAYALAATGIAVLYLDVIAATTLHEFLPPYAGLLAGLAVAGAGIALAGRWESQLLAVFVVVCCALCAPVLTRGFVPLLLGFLLVLQIATSPVHLARRWGGLCLAAGLPPVLATLISVALAAGHRFGVDSATTAVLCLVTSAVQVTLATVSASRRPTDNLPFALLLTAPVPTMLAAILVPRTAATLLPAAIGVLLVVVWALHQTGVLAVPERFAMVAGGAGLLAGLQATATALDGNARAIAVLAESVLLTMLAIRLRYAAALLASALFGLIGLVLTVGFAVPPRMLAVAPVHPLSRGTVVTAGLTALLLAVAAIALCWAATTLGRLGGQHGIRQAWVWAGLVGLYGATGAVLAIGLMISPDRAGFLLGHVLVTVSWTVGALALLLRGVDSVPLRVAGLALVASALVKLVLFDLSSLDGIARVAAFLVAGLVLLAAGVRYARLVASRGRPAGNG